MEAEKVRRLMACSPTEVDEVATLLEVPIPQAKGVRLQLLRMLTGKCPICGGPAGYGMCRTCKRSAKAKPFLGTKPFRLLKKMNPDDLLTKRVCGRCEKEFAVIVREVVRAFAKGPGSRLPKLCHSCEKGSEKPCQVEQESPEAFNRAFAKPLEELLEAGKLRPAGKKKRRRRPERKRAQKVKKRGVKQG